MLNVMWFKKSSGSQASSRASLHKQRRGIRLTLAHGEIFTWPRFISNELKENQLCNVAKVKCLMRCCEHSGDLLSSLNKALNELLPPDAAMKANNRF